MNKTVWILLAALPLSAIQAMAAKPTTAGSTNDVLIIGSEARCTQSKGIAIEEVPDNQVKWACLKDSAVQTACNPDGSHARVNAFRQWEAQLMDFKDRCTTVGGVFAFADTQFTEPNDASFCSIAQPEVQYSEFETPLCNFVSRCPRVAVTCVKTEEAIQNAQRMVLLPGVPRAVSVAY